MKPIHLTIAAFCCGAVAGTSFPAGAAEPGTLIDGSRLDVPPSSRQKPYAPADGQVVEVNPPPFIWVPAGRDAVYRLQVSPSDNFPAEGTRTFKGLTHSVHVPDKTLPPGRWFWRYGVETERGPVFGRPRPFTIPATARPFPFPDLDAAAKQVRRDRPRLFFGGERLAQVRAAARGELKDAVRDLVRSCEKAIGEPLVAEPGYRPKEPGLGGPWQTNVMRTVLPPMRVMENCALAYLITGDRRLGLEAKRRLQYFFSWDPEGPTSFFAYDEPPMWMMACGTRAYDWTHDLFAPEERARIEPNMKVRALQFLKELQGAPFESNPYYSSHAARLPGFLGECALSFIHEWPEARRWLEYATLLYMTSYPAWGGDDGGWQEGPGYWRNYMTFAVHYVVALRQATGIDLMQKTFFRNTPNYALYAAMPYQEHSPFGDGQNDPPGSLGRVMYAFSTLTQNPHFRWYADAARYRPGGDVLSLATYDPALQSRPPSELPPARVFPSVGLVSMHTALGNAHEDISLLLRSSPYGSVSHGHADQNAFAIEAFGRGLAIATGYYPWYGSAHHHNWTRATKAVNSVLVDGEGQVRRSWDAKGEITAFKSVEGYDYAEGEAGAAYGGRLDRFRRHILHVRPGIFVIFDDLVAPKPSTYQWLLHAYDRIDVDEGKRVLDIRRGPAGMKTVLLEPTAVRLSQTDRYVPEPESTVAEPKNTWHLTASTTQPATSGQFLAVLMPHRAGRDATLPQAALVRGRGAIGARLSFPDGSQELIAFRTDASAKAIECGGFESDGRVIAGRRDNNGAVTRHFLLEGATLSDQGRRIAPF